MARPTCWECGKQLMYVKGKPVWAVVVEDNVEHRVHKDCQDRGVSKEARAASARQDVKKAFCTTGCKP
jgi:nucleoside 2-deoxyribosyltransferase